ncbi:phage N-6-adenine-methyltransferase [Trabulsiella odontotermitis]|uniref:phage N-6-adenine-methyltransferase n=1 Tax=Trabulsiella odontotermitis TaxID=379893 RepID=UPI0024B7F273|nr:phage N-6-adenine-methyltransferase [Trabulsiella odontotermitis]WHP33482.1 phage N-6-adenine-methyltransferase [Trabulsiella odontotermitis]
MDDVALDPEEPESQKSPYVQALDALRAQSVHYLKEVGDQWCSPDSLFWGINAMFGPFVLDLFAADDNAKCPAWYTAEINALTQDWSADLAALGGAAFANPPYSRSQYDGKQAITGMRNIMNYTRAMREKGGRYIFFIKSATSETWWPEDADHVAFIRGRISFDLPTWFNPADEKQIPSGARFAGAIAVFDKTWRGAAFSYVDADELEEKGRAFMALAQFAIGKVQKPAPITASLPETESRIWPLEVGLLFTQVNGTADLNAQQQNKLKANINQLWLERMPGSEIITIAGGLVSSMQGATNA